VIFLLFVMGGFFGGCGSCGSCGSVRRDLVVGASGEALGFAGVAFSSTHREGKK
jgi:hypothetical protein